MASIRSVSARRPPRRTGSRVIARWLVVALGLSLATSALGADVACLRGINLAGAEFGTPPGIPGKTYRYPSQETIDYFVAQGFNTVRLPFLWERLQPQLSKPFDAAELARLSESVRRMRVLGIKVVLDPHNYGRFNGQLIGSTAVPVDAFTDLWVRLARIFGEDGSVYFGLMNEPHEISAADWVETANAAIAGIRTAGARNLVLVPGTAWTGAHSWFSDWYGGANAVAMAQLKDPADHYAIELHQYVDDDFSGTKDNCRRADEAIASVGKVAEWLRSTKRRGFLGEFGVTRDPACVAAAQAMTAAVDRDRDVWIGWAYWAAGDLWPDAEALNIQPGPAGDKPQLAGLRASLGGSPDVAACSMLQK